MDELLPYYERELGFLRKYTREFSERYPKIAGRLLISGDVCQDPHVERMIESFALLNARISKKLEDDYPEFTEALLEVLYPHYLRPFPSCSIARFDAGGATAQLTTTPVIARGTELLTRPVRGVACRFRSVYDVVLAPLRLSQARFEAIAQPPETVRLPKDATGQISLTLELTSEQADFSTQPASLRLFIDGEPSFASTLRDALFMHTVRAYVEPAGSGRWHALDKVPLDPAGFGDTESLIEYPDRSHPAYRLLTEYFAFPEKFNFFDLDLAALARAAGARQGMRSLTVHLILGGLRHDSGPARLLEALSAPNLLLGCTPIVNLFKQRGDPIRITHTAASYPVVADGRRAHAYEVHSIDSVKRVRQTPQGESITEFRPFYSLRHGEIPEQSGHYWVAHRNDDVAQRSPGYELEISIVDIDFDPVLPQVDTLSIELTCSNRELPSMLAYGLAGGDLYIEGGTVARSITMLRKPTVSLAFERGRGAHWRLISHLSLNHLSLAQSGLSAFKEMLRLYDLPRSAISGRLIEGLVELEHRLVSAWLPGKRFASVVRGVEVRLSLDEDSFVGAGIDTFAQIVDRFLGLYVSVNSFTQLVLVSKRTGREILRCLPRSGDQALV